MTDRDWLKAVLITGASSGIGRELARLFAGDGHNLVLVARNKPKLQQLARELEGRHGIRALVLPRDLSRSGAASELFAATQKRSLEIEVLVNNAATLFAGDFGHVSLQDHLEVIQLNMVALTTLAYLFLQPMLERGHGRILNVASMAGFQPVPRLAMYAASKAYVLHLTEALAEELRGTGVTATVLCPGFTQTDMISRDPEVRLPPAAIGAPQDVAWDGYRACMSGTPLCVSGLMNQMAVQMIRLQPRWLVRALGGTMSRRRSQ